MRVLLADDSMTIRMILKNLLGELGITDVAESRNGQEALDLLSQSQFDLVLTDIHMPKVDGLTVLEEIKTNPGSTHKYVPVVVISSDTDYRQIDRAKNLGAFGYIKKPFKRESLQAAIAAAQEAEARRQSEEALNSATQATEQLNEAADALSAAKPTAESVPATVGAEHASNGMNSRPATVVTQAAPLRSRASSPKPGGGGLLGWIRKIFGKKN